MGKLKIETENLLPVGPDGLSPRGVKALLWISTKRLLRQGCCLLVLVLMILTVALLPLILQARPLASYFLTPSVENYRYYRQHFHNLTVCQAAVSPLLYPSPGGVSVLVGLVDTSTIQDYLETRTRIRVVDTVCRLERITSCLTEVYQAHGLLVLVETADDLARFPDLPVKDLIYLQGNPFREVVYLDNNRLHRAGYNDRDRFSWEYFSKVSASSPLTELEKLRRRYPGKPLQYLQYQNQTRPILEQIYHWSVHSRSDVTPVDCSGPGGFKIPKESLDLVQVSAVRRNIWCDEFKPWWNETVWGHCQV